MGIRSRIFLIIFISLGIGILISSIVAERDLSNTFQEQILLELEKQASLLVEVVDEVDSIGDINVADSLADRLGDASNSRITFILNNGTVIGDSNVNKSDVYLLDNHRNRSEINDALVFGTGWSIRYSDTLNQQQLYFAITDNNEESPNVIRIAVPLSLIHI